MKGTRVLDLALDFVTMDALHDFRDGRNDNLWIDKLLGRSELGADERDLLAATGSWRRPGRGIAL